MGYPTAVIPGLREAQNPESRSLILCLKAGFRVHRREDGDAPE
ncbi:MAG: hypothetical protein OJF55_001531 [Rhodanobacteraceae bacterium]|nr:MAG: hypothetical protein OJF55_001531 [Rhodanobacteraceae bacterium]